MLITTRQCCLGIASEQEHAIKAIQADVESLKKRVEQIDANIISLKCQGCVENSQYTLQETHQ